MRRRSVCGAATVVAVAILLLSRTAAAHVDYIVDEDPETIGAAIQFIVETVLDPLNAALLAAGAVMVMDYLPVGSL